MMIKMVFIIAIIFSPFFVNSVESQEVILSVAGGQGEPGSSGNIVDINLYNSARVQSLQSELLFDTEI